MPLATLRFACGGKPWRAAEDTTPSMHGALAQAWAHGGTSPPMHSGCVASGESDVEKGMRPRQAALKGAREIGFAVLAMTITLAAVYMPIGFMEGTTGRLFTEFAMTLAGAVLVSGFVALTLSPMMCSKMLKPHQSHGWLYNAGERLLNGLNGGYRRTLRVALKVRPLVLMVGLAVAGAGGWFFQQLKTELAPYEDQGTFLGIGIAPEGATVEYTDGFARRMEALYAEIPEAQRYFMVTGFPTVSPVSSCAGRRPPPPPPFYAPEYRNQ